MNNASYYLMKNGYILRMEDAFDKEDIPILLKANMLEPAQVEALNQEQANFRVAIFRDEILELDEYNERVFGQQSY
jgi:hypothetical protein